MGSIRQSLSPILLPLAIPAASVMAALLAVALLAAVIGQSPALALGTLVKGSLGSLEGLGYTLFYATDYVFAGLAVALPFQAGLFNIGGEGQAALGGLGAALAAFALKGLPGPLALAGAGAAAASFGAAWAFVPAYLQARRGSHLVVTTIMFNFIASALLTYLLAHVLIAPGQSALETRAFARATWLPTLGDWAAAHGMDAGSAPLNPTALLALGAAFFYAMLLRRTPLGYEIRAAGLNPLAARTAGISLARTTIVSVSLGGAFAGLLALNELFGAQHRLVLGFTAGAGFTGIAVALMGRGRALGILFAALLFGALAQGGAELSFTMPAVTRDAVIVAQGVVIFVCGALDGAVRRHVAGLLRMARGSA